MKPLAKFWTWTGHLFIPLAVGWAVYVSNGFGDKPVPDGVLISRGYWGVLVALIAGTALTWSCVLYVRLAKRRHSDYLIPPNTTFEDGEERSAVISYGTAIAFALAVTGALIRFGVRYSESLIHGWNERGPLAPGFWATRLEAHRIGCASPPCFAVGPRVDSSGPVFGVNEYLLYVTDGGILILGLFLTSGLVYLVWLLNTSKNAQSTQSRANRRKARRK